jgi:hypothetical protein
MSNFGLAICLHEVEKQKCKGLAVRVHNLNLRRMYKTQPEAIKQAIIDDEV